jgi:chromate transporter
VRCTRAVRCAFRGRPLHHRGLLVHGIDIVCESGGDDCAGVLRHLRRNCPFERRSLHRGAAYVRGFGPITNQNLLRGKRDLSTAINDSGDKPAMAQGTPIEVFRVFLKLGLTSFGGPVAHLGYFREELVVRRKWIDEASYIDLVALCQFLPGPASSQVGFSLGVLRGNGPFGGLAAWLGFTAPSAFILLAFALSAAAFAGPVAEAFLHGLKLVAVAVVAQAVWGMTRTLTPDRSRAAIALAAMVVVIVAAGSFGQIAGIVLGAVAGLTFCRGEAKATSGQLRFPVSRRGGAAALVLFAALFVIPLIVGGGNQAVALFGAFYRSGSLVFGGGHVVLPLLQAEVVTPHWVTNETFLAGYGLTQAMPGPLFTFAAYLGAVMQPTPNGVAGSAIALIAIFLPGVLLVYGMLPFWDELRSRQTMQAAMRGANAAVVGILGLALYNPIWTSAVLTPRDFAFALGGFLLLTVWKVPPWIVVVLLAAGVTLLVVPHYS